MPIFHEKTVKENNKKEDENDILDEVKVARLSHRRKRSAQHKLQAIPTSSIESRIKSWGAEIDSVIQNIININKGKSECINYTDIIFSSLLDDISRRIPTLDNNEKIKSIVNELYILLQFYAIIDNERSITEHQFSHSFSQKEEHVIIKDFIQDDFLIKITQLPKDDLEDSIAKLYSVNEKLKLLYGPIPKVIDYFNGHIEYLNSRYFDRYIPRNIYLLSKARLEIILGDLRYQINKKNVYSPNVFFDLKKDLHDKIIKLLRTRYEDSDSNIPFYEEVYNYTYQNIMLLKNKHNDEETKKHFNSKMASFRKQYDIPVYDFIYSYAEKESKNQGENRAKNIFPAAIESAKNELLENLIAIYDNLLTNFTDVEEANIDWLKTNILRKRLNEIESYQGELIDIINITSDLKDWKPISSAWRKVSRDNFDLNLSVDEFKYQAILLLESFISPSAALSGRQDYIDCYNSIVAGNSIVSENIKNKLLLFVSTRRYLLNEYLNNSKDGAMPINKFIELINPTDLNSMTLEDLERSALYSLEGNKDRIYTHLSQLHKRDEYGSHKRYYETYNEYISLHSYREASDYTFEIITKYKDILGGSRKILEKPTRIEKYKIISDLVHFSSDGSEERFLQSSEKPLLGEISVITFKDNKKFILSTLSNYPFVVEMTDKINSDLKSFLEIPPKSSPNSFRTLLTSIYQIDIFDEILKINSITESFKAPSLVPSERYKEYLRVYNTENTEEKYDYSLFDLMKYMMRDIFSSFAEIMKDQNQYSSAIDVVINLIPFYSIITRKISDPEYNPTVKEMVWDIVDISVSLAASVLKLGYSAIKALNTAFSSAIKQAKAVNAGIKGSALLKEALRIATPELIKKVPGIAKVLKLLTLWTANTLNPLAPLMLFSPVVSWGVKGIRNIPKRLRKKKIYLPPSIEDGEKVIKKPFGTTSEYDDLLYIDEMTPDEIVTARNVFYNDISHESVLKNDLEQLAKNPSGNCDKAVEKVLSLLNGKGYQAKVVGALMYKSVMDTAPLNHYVVVASKESKDLVIDVTFDQFQASRGGEWLVTSWEDWCRRMIKSDKLKNQLITVKEYSMLSEAKTEIAFTDGSTWLESRYLKDDDFKILQLPERFIKHIDTLYRKDIEFLSASEGLRRLNNLEDNIRDKKNNLIKLKREENVYVNKEETVPDNLQDKISKAEKIVNELEGMRNISNRIENYFHLKSTLDEIKLNDVPFSAPISNTLENIIKYSDDIAFVKLDDIDVQSIDNNGIVKSDGNYYLPFDSKLILLNKYDSKQASARIMMNGKSTSILLNGYKWRYFDIDGTINGNIDKLSKGSISPLKGQGLLNAQQNQKITTNFDFIRIDAEKGMVDSKVFSNDELTNNGLLAGKLSVTTGSKLSSQTANGPFVGKWKTNDLDDNLEFIKVSNGSSGCVAIKIPFNNIPSDKPVIISGGQLSGCTMVYATDSKHFYAYHAGQNPGDDNWLTGREGVRSIYNAHLKLKGTPVPAADQAINNNSINNNILNEIFSVYDNSMITYLGKNTAKTGSTRISDISQQNINKFDYNAASPRKSDVRVGLAYALLTKQGNSTSIAAYSEDLSISLENGSLSMLASCEVQLKGTQYVSKEIISFDDSVEQLGNVYTGFRGIRNSINIPNQDVKNPPSSNNMLNQNTKDASKKLPSDSPPRVSAPVEQDLEKYISILTFLKDYKKFIFDSIRSDFNERRGEGIYRDKGEGRFYIIKIAGKYLRFKYHISNNKSIKNGVLFIDDQQVYIKRINYKWTTDSQGKLMVTPESKATDALVYRVREEVKRNKAKGYFPLPTDFHRTSGASIYVNHNNGSYMFVDGAYWPFCYASDPKYKGDEYSSRLGMLTVGNVTIPIFRETWFWDPNPF
ncbi:cytotoxic necrotizing factor Rho-activating domain-containing protein [Photorhabdus laumondii]|uniref:cytotoxic necrotizing factor Rho-activating domain-containing protein n=1 Tax=Photorhabdus laumondii TaxID=2218628 RepID=UPI00331499A2